MIATLFLFVKKNNSLTEVPENDRIIATNEGMIMENVYVLAITSNMLLTDSCTLHSR